MHSVGAVAPTQPLPRGRVALTHQFEQSLCLRRMNLLSGFDRDLMFAVGDQLPDAGLRSSTESGSIKSGCSRGAGRWPVLLKSVPHAVPGSFFSVVAV